MSRMIVAFSGKAGAGKSLCASYLTSKYDFRKMSFATVLKELAINWYFWDGKKDERGRKLLQNIGNIGRTYDSEIWVKHLEMSMMNLLGPQLIVIDDCRYENEAKWVKEQGGTVVRINRKDTALSGEAAKHPSETELDHYKGFNHIIDNNLDKFTLFQRVDKIVEPLMA